VKNLTVKTILKKVLDLKGFVIAAVWMEGEAIRVRLRERNGAKAHCSGCRRPASCYDRLQERLWQFVPLWGFVVMISYRLRRVDCKRCGVVVEHVPWASGKHQLCDAFRLFLAQWARLLSWREVAGRFAVGWAQVYESVQWVVDYGLEHRDLSGIKAIGIDEIHVRKVGRVFWTLVYQIDEGARRLLWVGADRTKKTFHQFFDEIGEEVTEGIEFVCSDMWRAYLAVVKKRLKKAVHVIDRFHVVKRLLEAVDDIRRNEAKAMAKAGLKPLLKKMRYAFLRNRRKWSPAERKRMKELEGANLAVFHAKLLVEQFDHFWKYRSVCWGAKFLEEWLKKIRRIRRPGMEPLKKAAKTIERHQKYLLNYIASGGLNSGVVEGLNRKLKTATNRSYGYRTDKALKAALYHELGNLPLPKFTHSFF